MGDDSVVTGDVVLAAREPSEEQKLRERVARLERLIVGGLEELEEIDKDMQDGAVATVEESAFVDTMFDELEDEMSSYTTACVACLCTPGELGWRTWVTLLGRTLCAVILVMTLNMLCAAVQDQKNVLSDWEDDMVFGWGATFTRHTTYYGHVYEYMIGDIPVPTFITMLMGSFVIALDMRGGFREQLLNHLSLHYSREQLRCCAPRGGALAADEAVSFYRWMLAQVLDKCVRIFNISYISAAIFLVGTSDGTVDLILNCTALSFMLGVDNLMNEGFAMFTPKGYGKKEEIVFIEHIDEETQLKKMLARVRKDEDGLKRFEFGIWINFLATCLTIVVGGCLMQNYTAYGDTFEFNESGPGDGIGIAADANVLSKTVRGCLIGLMVVFTFTDSVLVGSVLTYGEPFWSRVRTALVTFSFEFVIFYLLYIVLHHILILETIMEWNSDRGELKDCYDEHGDDCKFRARGYNGEAPN
ncbi:hypothetical protein SO694_00074169 [Aureococcus anophagefferens]|uniref:Ion transport domain-containing protein n=1 Tax=Aureococcus anophagefferens TaxID=44056 RepID=A0ABR1FHN4_AURAN